MDRLLEPLMRECQEERHGRRKARVARKGPAVGLSVCPSPWLTESWPWLHLSDVPGMHVPLHAVVGLV